MKKLSPIKKFYSDALAVWLLVAVIGLSGVLYGYFTVETVSRAVDKRALREEVAELENEISGLEYTYLQKSNGITLHSTPELKMAEAEDPVYIDRRSLSRR